MFIKKNYKCSLYGFQKFKVLSHKTMTNFIHSNINKMNNFKL